LGSLDLGNHYWRAGRLKLKEGKVLAQKFTSKKVSPWFNLNLGLRVGTSNFPTPGGPGIPFNQGTITFYQNSLRKVGVIGLNPLTP